MTPDIPQKHREVILALLVEDDALLRGALVDALPLHGITVADDCDTASTAGRHLTQTKYDVLITDLNLGSGPNGIVLANAARRLQPRLGIVLLTSYSDPRLLDHKLTQTPIGTVYLAKHEVSNMSVLHAGVVRSIADAATPTMHEHESILQSRRFTDSQTETMRLVAEGWSNAEIADRRVVSIRTVETSIARVARELGIPQSQMHNQRVLITREYFRLAGSTGASRAEDS